ncbi:deaminase domain-containing protein [Pseudomonas fontis]
MDVRAGLPSGLRRSGNVAVAEIDIPGIPKQMAAHSQVSFRQNCLSSETASRSDSGMVLRPLLRGLPRVRLGGQERQRKVQRAQSKRVKRLVSR